MVLAAGLALAGSLAGLLVSFHGGIAASAAITLSLGVLYALSLSLGLHGSLLARRRMAALAFRSNRYRRSS
jgi:zinc/manganese transport system permease protein